MPTRAEPRVRDEEPSLDGFDATPEESVAILRTLVAALTDRCDDARRRSRPFVNLMAYALAGSGLGFLIWVLPTPSDVAVLREWIAKGTGAVLVVGAVVEVVRAWRARSLARRLKRLRQQLALAESQAAAGPAR